MGYLRQLIREALARPPAAGLTPAEFAALARDHGSEAAAVRALQGHATRSGQPVAVQLARPDGSRGSLYLSPRGWLTETLTDADGRFRARGPMAAEEWSAPATGAS